MNRDLVTYLLTKAMVAKGYHDLRRLKKNTVNARKKNEKLLFKILKNGENTEYGIKHDFKNIKSVEDYRANVPISSYSDYEPYIERMINNNEEDLLTSLPLIGYSKSSGTTGSPKFIPLTQNIASIYQRNTLTCMMAMADRYCREKFGRPLKPGRGMFLCVDFDEKLPNGRSATNVPEQTAKQLGFMYPYILNVPFSKLFKATDVSLYYMLLRFGLEDRDTMYIFSVFFSIIYELLAFMMANWETLVNDIEKGTVDQTLGRPIPEVREMLEKVIKPNPERAAELRREFEKGFDETLLQRLWPNLSVIYGISGSIYTVYSNGVRKIAGDIPFDYSIYGASEGLFAAPWQLNDENRLLVADSCYFEFIPVDDDTKVLSLDELVPGEEYEIIITNQAGFYRYRINDIIKCEGYENDSPVITFCRRKGHMISIIGEKTSEEHFLSLIERIEEASGHTINDWIVYINNDTRPSHYTLLLENKDGADLSGYAELADKCMYEINDIYRRFRDTRSIYPITIQNQIPGTHAEWKELRISMGTAPTQVKPVRLLDSDDKIDFFLSRVQ